jgi:hypothetical protein
MMSDWRDPIVEEVRRARDAHARSLGYDLDRIIADIKQRERVSGRRFVRPRPRRIPAEPPPPRNAGE